MSVLGSNRDPGMDRTYVQCPQGIGTDISSGLYTAVPHAPLPYPYVSIQNWESFPTYIFFDILVKYQILIDTYIFSRHSDTSAPDEVILSMKCVENQDAAIF